MPKSSSRDTCFKPSELIAVVGSLSRTKGGTTYEINKVISHKEYNKPNRYSNDIAVISTKEAIEFNKKVKPLPLPTKDITAGLSCVVSGWGLLGGKKSSPKNLQYLYINTLTSDDCTLLRDDYDPINSNQMCTLNKFGEGTCHGDSGGSLVCNGSSAGVVSFNRPCARNYPDTYTNMYMYIPG